jgi:hypothetical protein
VSFVNYKRVNSWALCQLWLDEILREHPNSLMSDWVPRCND